MEQADSDEPLGPPTVLVALISTFRLSLAQQAEPNPRIMYLSACSPSLSDSYWGQRVCSLLVQGIIICSFSGVNALYSEL